MRVGHFSFSVLRKMRPANVTITEWPFSSAQSAQSAEWRMKEKKTETRTKREKEPTHTDLLLHMAMFDDPSPFPNSYILYSVAYFSWLQKCMSACWIFSSPSSSSSSSSFFSSSFDERHFEYVMKWSNISNIRFIFTLLNELFAERSKPLAHG